MAQELQAILIEYWHDIDTNWGRNAGMYYTDDADFIGEAATYSGRAKIEEFYAWRIKQGPRLAVHAVSNFRVANAEARPSQGNLVPASLCWEWRADSANPPADHHFAGDRRLCAGAGRRVAVQQATLQDLVSGRSTRAQPQAVRRATGRRLAADPHGLGTLTSSRMPAIPSSRP